MKLLLYFLTALLFFNAADAQDSIFNFTTSDGVHLYVRIAGKGEPCLFLHGGPGLTSYYFEALPAAKMIGQKVKMIYFDQRGSGRSSSAKDSNYSIKRMEQDIEELRTSLQIKKWSVMGHSFGGVIETAYAKDYPGVIRSLIYVHCTIDIRSALESHITNGLKLLKEVGDPFRIPTGLSPFDQMIKVHEELAKKGIEYKIMFNSQRSKDIDDSITNLIHCNQDFQHRIWTLKEYWTDFAQYTKDIVCPVLVIAGKKDYAVGPDSYKAWRFKNQKVVLYEAAHFSFLEKPTWFVNTVLRFLKEDSAIGKVEIYDSRATNIIDSNAVIEVIGKNYKWSEGPVWMPAQQMLLFSAVKENKIYRWNGKDTPVVYLTPSGYTDTAYRDGENGSNGLALDKNGQLLLCQSGNRQVVRLNASLDAPKPTFTVLAPDYQGKKFNSPNDLVADSRNNIYFTDPIYGLPKGADDPTRELKFEGVYKITPAGKIILLIDTISRPNGIALSPDEKILYVGSSDEKHTRWYAYRLDGNGGIRSGGILLDGTEMKDRATVKQGADGFKIDRYGNIFSAGPDGVNIISPSGKLLGLIKVYDRPTSNCAFNETKDMLYITAADWVLRVKLK